MYKRAASLSPGLHKGKLRWKLRGKQQHGGERKEWKAIMTEK